MPIVRLLILPLVWGFLALCAVFMLVYGGLFWVMTGETYTIRLNIGS